MKYVIGDPEYFDNVLNSKARLELKVMALPVRPLPMAAP